jgi:hypothetical protein
MPNIFLHPKSDPALITRPIKRAIVLGPVKDKPFGRP